ncbi:uncharacterized protein LOC124270391 [Haliotis rubra]|uniref:uncharacterized protein LOC124270391 n=1 Tax=Haliotis rubra TaxID=36100 RepID=UPI001EE5FEB7|nr:uncharacterized protein LOC124270391 [Haliotis rubra]XP_046561391.1 uncharacterized protein LOC124270391 [Haliotis rubra]
MQNRNTDRVRTSSPMQMSPAGEQVVGKNIEGSKPADLSEMQNRNTDRVRTSSPMQMSPAAEQVVGKNIEGSKPADLSEMPNRNTDRVRTSSPMQMSPAGEQVVGGSSEPLGQEHGPSATEVITPSGTMERSTCVKQSGGTTERVQTPLEPGPTPADSGEADRDTDVPCTTSVGFLLDLTEGGRNNTIKENIMFEMSDHPVSRLQTAYGLGAQLLGYEHWQLEKLWEAQMPCCDAKVERVRNILKALKAEGKTMNDVLLYFIHEASRRLDIVKLIMEIHQCECCKKVFKNVNM